MQGISLLAEDLLASQEELCSLGFVVLQYAAFLRNIRQVPCSKGIHGNAVSIVTRLWAGRSGARIPIRARYFLFTKTCRLALRVHLASYWTGSGVFFPAVKRPGNVFDHSPPSSAEVKNEWSYTSTSPPCLHSVDKDKFTRVQILEQRPAMLHYGVFQVSPGKCRYNTLN
jgi:hypothetical protein